MIGPSGSGKSKLSEMFIAPLSSGVGIYTMNTTDNGIRQEMTAGAQAHGAGILICDEMAQDTAGKAQRSAAIVAMSRESAAGGAGATTSLRGQQTQKSLSSTFSGSFHLSSVGYHLSDSQDLSRYMILNLEGTFSPDNDRIVAATEAVEVIIPSFIKTVLLGAKYYNDLYGLMQDRVRKLAGGSSGGQKYSHRISCLAAATAGWGAIIKVLNPDKTLEQVADKTLTDCEEFIKNQLEQYIEGTGGMDNVIRKILRTQIMENGYSAPLLDHIKDPEVGKSYSNSHAIKLKDGYLDIYYERVEDLNNLFNDKRKVMSTFRVDKNSLLECTKLDYVTRKRTSIMEGGKKVNVWVLRVKVGDDV